MILPQAFTRHENTIRVVVETPKGSRNKYTYEKKSGYFQLSKTLPLGTFFPFDFGFIPHTLGEDGDPLDIMIIADLPSFSGCVIECRILGLLEMEQKEKKQKPVRNDRILAVAAESLCYSHLNKMDDLNENLVNELIHFFKYYNEMEGKKVQFLGTKNGHAAMKLIRSNLEDKK